MNLQLHFAQKIIKKSLKLAEIDLFHSNAKIGFFWQKNPKSGKSRHHALKERCPLCRSLLTLRDRAKHDKSIDVTEIAEAEFAHNEFWLNQRDLVRTMNNLVEDYIDEDSDLDGSYDSDDIVFTS